MVAKIINSNLEVSLISGKEWNALTKERKADYFKRYVHMAELKSNRRISYADIANEIGTTRQAISTYGNMHNDTNMSFPMYYTITHALDELSLK